MGGKADIFGDDDRVDVGQLDPQSLAHRVARATVAIVDVAKLRETKTGFELREDRVFEYADAHGLCESEAFGDEPALADCAGFLVAPDVLVTAGHCLQGFGACGRARFVLDWTNEPEAQTLASTLPRARIRGCEEILAREVEAAHGIDYAIVRLDAPVLDRQPLPLRPYGQPALEQALLTVGFPGGVPAKVSPGTVRREVGAELEDLPAFVGTGLGIDTDAVPGNSGGPVVSLDYGWVEGILARPAVEHAEDAYRPSPDDPSCNVVTTCDGSDDCPFGFVEAFPIEDVVAALAEHDVEPAGGGP